MSLARSLIPKNTLLNCTPWSWVELAIFSHIVVLDKLPIGPDSCSTVPGGSIVRLSSFMNAPSILFRIQDVHWLAQRA